MLGFDNNKRMEKLDLLLPPASPTKRQTSRRNLLADTKTKQTSRRHLLEPTKPPSRRNLLAESRPTSQRSIGDTGSRRRLMLTESRSTSQHSLEPTKPPSRRNLLAEPRSTSQRSIGNGGSRRRLLLTGSTSQHRLDPVKPPCRRTLLGASRSTSQPKLVREGSRRRLLLAQPRSTSQRRVDPVKPPCRRTQLGASRSTSQPKLVREGSRRRFLLGSSHYGSRRKMLLHGDSCGTMNTSHSSFTRTSSRSLMQPRGLAQVQQAWQQWRASDGGFDIRLFEQVFFAMMELQPNVRTRLGIASLRSPRFAQVARLLVDGIEAILMTWDMDDELDSWRCIWKSEDLDPFLVSKVWMDSLRATGVSYASGDDQGLFVQAWEETVLSVLRKWST